MSLNAVGIQVLQGPRELPILRAEIPAVAFWGFPKIRGPLLGSPYNKSPTILGSILGPMIFGISHTVPNSHLRYF